MGDDPHTSFKRDVMEFVGAYTDSDDSGDERGGHWKATVAAALKGRRKRVVSGIRVEGRTKINLLGEMEAIVLHLVDAVRDNYDVDFITPG